MRSSSSNHQHSFYMEPYPQPASLYGQLHPSYTPPDPAPHPDEVLQALPDMRRDILGATIVNTLRRIQDALTHHHSWPWGFLHK